MIHVSSRNMEHVLLFHSAARLAEALFTAIAAGDRQPEVQSAKLMGILRNPADRPLREAHTGKREPRLLEAPADTLTPLKKLLQRLRDLGSLRSKVCSKDKHNSQVCV